MAFRTRGRVIGMSSVTSSIDLLTNKADVQEYRGIITMKRQSRTFKIIQMLLTMTLILYIFVFCFSTKSEDKLAPLTTS